MKISSVNLMRYNRMGAKPPSCRNLEFEIFKLLKTVQLPFTIHQRYFKISGYMQRYTMAAIPFPLSLRESFNHTGPFTNILIFWWMISWDIIIIITYIFLQALWRRAFILPSDIHSPFLCLLTYILYAWNANFCIRKRMIMCINSYARECLINYWWLPVSAFLDKILVVLSFLLSKF